MHDEIMKHVNHSVSSFHNFPMIVVVFAMNEKLSESKSYVVEAFII